MPFVAYFCVSRPVQGEPRKGRYVQDAAPTESATTKGRLTHDFTDSCLCGDGSDRPRLCVWIRQLLVCRGDLQMTSYKCRYLRWCIRDGRVRSVKAKIESLFKFKRHQQKSSLLFTRCVFLILSQFPSDGCQACQSKFPTVAPCQQCRQVIHHPLPNSSPYLQTESRSRPTLSFPSTLISTTPRRELHPPSHDPNAPYGTATLNTSHHKVSLSKVITSRKQRSPTSPEPRWSSVAQLSSSLALPRLTIIVISCRAETIVCLFGVIQSISVNRTESRRVPSSKV